MNASYIYPGAHSLTPYLTIRGCIEAIMFYEKAFGAVEKGRITMPNGSIAHAEISIEGSLLMMAEENKDWGSISPQSLGGTAVTIGLYVADVDAVFKQAVDAGAIIKQPVTDMFYGDRTCSICDPYGHNWMISTHKTDMTFAEMQKGADAMFGNKE
jgi:PhnB protein